MIDSRVGAATEAYYACPVPDRFSPAKLAAYMLAAADAVEVEVALGEQRRRDEASREIDDFVQRFEA